MSGVCLRGSIDLYGIQRLDSCWLGVQRRRHRFSAAERGGTYGEHPDGVDGKLVQFSVRHDEWFGEGGVSRGQCFNWRRGEQALVGGTWGFVGKWEWGGGARWGALPAATIGAERSGYHGLYGRTAGSAGDCRCNTGREEYQATSPEKPQIRHNQRYGYSKCCTAVPTERVRTGFICSHAFRGYIYLI
jgi:hypothetical protein